MEEKGTSFKELYNMFLTATITDFQLNNLFINNEEAFYSYMSSYVKKATWEVSNSLITSLEYKEFDDGLYFLEELKGLEKLILVNYMAIYWYEKIMDDVLELKGMIGTTSEKIINNSGNLRHKLYRVGELRSENAANINKLQMEHLDELG